MQKNPCRLLDLKTIPLFLKNTDTDSSPQANRPVLRFQMPRVCEFLQALWIQAEGPNSQNAHSTQAKPAKCFQNNKQP